MNRRIGIALGTGVIVVAAAFLFAQNDPAGGQNQGQAAPPGQMGPWMMGYPGMMGMNPEMMGMMGMMNRSMVPSQDGSVVLMVGDELLKYDKDLNLVKRVEVKVDWQAMEKRMMDRMNSSQWGQMMHRHYMMGQRGMGGMGQGMGGMMPKGGSESGK